MYKYKIIKKSYGYVIINTVLDTHAHMPNYKGCRILLKLIKNNVDIKDPYLQKAKERLLALDTKKKRKKKQKYVNKRKYKC